KPLAAGARRRSGRALRPAGGAGAGRIRVLRGRRFAAQAARGCGGSRTGRREGRQGAAAKAGWHAVPGGADARSADLQREGAQRPRLAPSPRELRRGGGAALHALAFGAVAPTATRRRRERGRKPRTAFSGLLLLERWSDGIEQCAVALKGDALRIELQAAQTAELLAAPGVTGPPVEHLGHDGAGSHGLPGDLLAADVDAAVIGRDGENELA